MSEEETRPIETDLAVARDKGPETSRTLEKGLRLLTLFDVEHQQWSLRELREAAGESKTVVVRLVKTLERLGFVERNPQTSTYSLGNSVAKLAYVIESHERLVRVAQPFMQRLSDITSETILLCAETEHGWPMLLSVVTARYLVPSDAVGKGFRVGLGSVEARVFVAFRSKGDWDRFIVEAQRHEPSLNLREAREDLERVRREGVAFLFQDPDREIGTVAVPVFGPHGAVKATLTVITPFERFGERESVAQADAAREIAADLSEGLGAPQERAEFLRKKVGMGAADAFEPGG